MDIINQYGKSSVATVYLGITSTGKQVEFVDSLQRNIEREKKWVCIISSMIGCPVGCRFCDAGGFFKGKLSKGDMLEQIDFLVKKHYPDLSIPVEKWKIQFARMGEPSLNDAVLEILEVLPSLYHAPGLLPSLSSVGPKTGAGFFNRLIPIKDHHYPGRFQLQFSIHSTSEEQRNKWIPVQKWSFSEIAEFGERFKSAKDKKISLNFAVSEEAFIDPKVLRRYFHPDLFLVKMTPINPTYTSVFNQVRNDMHTETGELKSHPDLVKELKDQGFEVILSIGNPEENDIGSNCGQYVQKHLMNKHVDVNGYRYISQQKREK